MSLWEEWRGLHVASSWPAYVKSSQLFKHQIDDLAAATQKPVSADFMFRQPVPLRHEAAAMRSCERACSVLSRNERAFLLSYRCRVCPQFYSQLLTSKDEGIPFRRLSLRCFSKDLVLLRHHNSNRRSLEIYKYTPLDATKPSLKRCMSSLRAQAPALSRG